MALFLQRQDPRSRNYLLKLRNVMVGCDSYNSCYAILCVGAYYWVGVDVEVDVEVGLNAETGTTACMDAGVRALAAPSVRASKFIESGLMRVERWK